jgi:pimeloyl-ACP methyl ester carboxylesterase
MSTNYGVSIVLVHGAFADASSWNGVVERLHRAGQKVIAPANPLRSISIDSTYLASFISQIEGPLLLVGHSYGGAVITNAATTAKNVVGLVYVAGFAPDQGEKLIEVEAGSKDSVLNAALQPYKYPLDNGEMADEFYIKPELFHKTFAADLPEDQAAVLAATQRPASALAFSEASGDPAWKKLPSWAVVATGDKAAGSDVIRSMAQRANAKITELDGSHVIMISKPQEVTDVILEATSSHD